MLPFLGSGRFEWNYSRICYLSRGECTIADAENKSVTYILLWDFCI